MGVSYWIGLASRVDSTHRSTRPSNNPTDPAATHWANPEPTIDCQPPPRANRKTHPGPGLASGLTWGPGKPVPPHGYTGPGGGVVGQRASTDSHCNPQGVVSAKGGRWLPLLRLPVGWNGRPSTAPSRTRDSPFAASATVPCCGSLQAEPSTCPRGGWAIPAPRRRRRHE